MFCVITVIAVVLGTQTFGILTLRYPRRISNNPLQNPVRVMAINGNDLELVDGRTVHLDEDWMSTDVRDAINESRDQIEVAGIGESTSVYVYVSQKRFICGLGWHGLIDIPVIPVDVPGYERRILGVGRIQYPIGFASESPNR